MNERLSDFLARVCQLSSNLCESKMHHWKPCFVIALVVFSILVASKVIFTNYFGMGYLFSEITVLRTVELPNRERIDKQKWKSRFDVDIMKCLDDISSRLRENSKECEKQSKLKIFFVGDSRIRQEFYSFLRVNRSFNDVLF